MTATSLPETALAAVLSEYNEPLRVEELPVPQPEPRALLVRVAAATVCGSDVHIWEGQLEGVLPIERPLVLGHEIVGEVAAIGAGAELDSVGLPLKLGDRVVWEHEPCGHCHTCTITREPALCPSRRIGQLEACRRPPYFTGGFAEFSYVWPNSGRIIVPDEVETEWASAASCALRTIVHGFERAGKIGYLDTVLIQGSGPLGLFATAMAKTMRPRQIIAIGAPADRLELAKAWGADVTIDIAEHPDRDDRIAIVRELTGDGADVAFEVSGGRGAFGEGLEMVARAGRYVVIGTVGGEPQPVLAHRITNRELNVMGTFGAGIDSYYRALEFMRRYRSEFDWGRMLGERYGLARGHDRAGTQPVAGGDQADHRPCEERELRRSTPPWPTGSTARSASSPERRAVKAVRRRCASPRRAPRSRSPTSTPTASARPPARWRPPGARSSRTPATSRIRPPSMCSPREAVDRWGGIHILHNNAGTMLGAALDAYTAEDFDRLMHVNCLSQLYADPARRSRR